MLLTYDDLTIRNATPEDAGQLAVWWNDGKVMAHAGFPNGLGQTAWEIAERLRNDTDDTHRRLIIEVGHLAVGEMYYRNKGQGVAELGIKICDFSMQNKGIWKKLLSMLISALYHDLGYQKIILDTNANNKRAQRVYEQLGFQKVRVNKNAWTDHVGAWQSSIDYELDQKDFINFATGAPAVASPHAGRQRRRAGWTGSQKRGIVKTKYVYGRVCNEKTSL